MNSYYTAKDIEELAVNGTRQLVLNPGVFLTDFARETANQLGIELVRPELQRPSSSPISSTNNSKTLSDKYNKPAGCQRSFNTNPSGLPQTAIISGNRNGNGSSDPNTVNRLIDLVGKVIKRGG